MDGEHGAGELGGRGTGRGEREVKWKCDSHARGEECPLVGRMFGKEGE